MRLLSHKKALIAAAVLAVAVVLLVTVQNLPALMFGCEDLGDLTSATALDQGGVAARTLSAFELEEFQSLVGNLAPRGPRMSSRMGSDYAGYRSEMFELCLSSGKNVTLGVGNDFVELSDHGYWRVDSDAAYALFQFYFERLKS